MKRFSIKIFFLLIIFYGFTLFAQVNVINTVPANNANNSVPSANINVTFSNDMNTSTLNNTNIKVFGMVSGRHQSNNISYLSGTKTLTFNPNDDFIPGEVIFVSLTANIKASSGDTLEPFSWRFFVKPSDGTASFIQTSILGIHQKPTSVKSGDLDGDEIVELVLNNGPSNKITIYENDTNGRFTEQTSFSVGLSPFSVTLGDIDWDGDPDIVVTRETSPGVVEVWENQGSYIFSKISDITVGNFPRYSEFGDFDGDGDLDLAVSNSSSNNVFLMKNNGSGSFTISDTLSIPSPWGIAVADFNNDGDIDFAVASRFGDNVSIFMNGLARAGGAFNFINSQNVDVGDQPLNLVSGDFDGDGDADLAVSNHSSNTLSILKNNGTGSFVETSTPGVGTGPMEISPADLDNDGDLDLAVVNKTSNTVSILKNSGGGNFAVSSSPAVGLGPRAITTSDFDNDGNLDFAVAEKDANTFSIFKNKTNTNQDIGLSVNKLDFGRVIRDSSLVKNFVIINESTVNPLNITNITHNLSVYIPNKTSGNIATGDTMNLSVTFTPTQSQDYNDVLTVFSNDPDHPTMNIALTGSGGGSAPVVSTNLPDTSFAEDSGQLYMISNLNNYFSDPDPGDVLTYTAVSDTSDIQVTGTAGNRVYLNSSPNFFGKGQVIVTATDQTNLSTSDTFMVTVTAVNDTPIVASLPDLTFPEDGSSTLNLNSYITDIDDDTNSISWNSSVLNAQAIEVGVGDLQITIDQVTHVATIKATGDTSGIFDVEFVATDTSGAADQDTIMVTVTSASDAPYVASPVGDQSYAEDSGIQTVVSNLDTVFKDPDSGDSLSFSAKSDNANIPVSLTGISVKVTPASNYYGTGELIITATDKGGLSASDTFTVTITPVNDAPVVRGIPDVNMQEDGSSALDLDKYVSDVDDDTSSIKWSSVVLTATAIEVGVGDLTVSIDSVTHVASFTASGDTSGVFEVQFTATDTSGATGKDTTKVTVSKAGDAPVVKTPIGDVIYAEDSGAHTVAKDLKSVFHDADPKDSLSFTVTVDTSGVVASIAGDSLVLNSATNYNGMANVIVTATDKSNASVGDTFKVTITPVNDAPVVRGIPDVNMQEDGSSALDLDKYVSDVDDDTSSIKWSSVVLTATAIEVGVGDLTVSIDSVTHVATFSVSGDTSGVFEVEFTAMDTGGATGKDTIKVSVGAVNDPPKILSGYPDVEFKEDDTLSVSLEDVYTFVEDPETPDSALIYTLTGGNQTYYKIGSDSIYFSNKTPNWFGRDTVQLIVSDGELSDTADVYVIVESVNDVPVISGLPEFVEFSADSSVSLMLWEYVSDVETSDSSLLYMFNSSTDSITWSYDIKSGKLTIGADPVYDGVGNITVKVTDDSGAVDSASIKVTVNPNAIAGFGSEIPTAYELSQNYPNPFNPVTHIRFGLPQMSKVSLEVFNILGQRVLSLINAQQLPAGYHVVDLDAATLPSGIYIYRISAEGFHQVKKMILMK